MEPRPKTLEVTLAIRPIRFGRPPAQSHVPAGVGRSIYFLDLVVDFLLADFLPELFELDLLLLFFAMALVPPFLSDKFTDTSKSRQRNFCDW